MTAAGAAENVFPRPSSSLAIAVTIAVLIGAGAAASFVSVALLLSTFGAEKPVAYGIGTSPSGTIKAIGDPDQRLLLFQR